MAIVNMSNFSLFAFDSDRSSLLHELQKFKYVHFQDLDKEEGLKEIGLENVEVPEALVAVDEEMSKINYCIDIFSNFYTRETGLKALKEGKRNFEFHELEEKANSIDYNPIYQQLRGTWSKREELMQEIDRLKTKIQEYTPWKGLNSPIKDLEGFKQSVIYMGTIPKKLRPRLEEELLNTEYSYTEIVSEDKENTYLISLTSREEAESLHEILRNNNFSSVTLMGEKTPEQEISAINDEIKRLEDEVKVCENNCNTLSENLPDFEVVSEYLNNKKLRVASSENFVKTKEVNVIKGYVPTDMVQTFEDSIQKVLGNLYYLETKEADKDDVKTPILLRNSKFAQSFESLTSMYALPQYNEIDPTPFLAPFYLLFFGMMGADFGYGLLMLIGTSIVLKKFNLSDSTRLFMRFFFYLSFSVMLWGLVYGSMFGLDLPMKKLINPATDYNSLLVISIIFGLIHIYFGLGLKGYLLIKSGAVWDAICDVGFWYLALTGGIIYLISMVAVISPILKTISLGVMIIGMVGIVLTGGREASSIGGKLGGGVYSLYGISSYVGDFVSYSRLMALGLSGGFIAGAVNMIARMLAESGVVGMVFAFVIFVGGQLFNLGLSLLGAYVHSIRLIFVEFFGKFYDGGGKAFNIYRSKEKYINLK